LIDSHRAVAGVLEDGLPPGPSPEEEENVSFPAGHFRGKDPREMGLDLNRINMRGMDLSGALLEALTLVPGKCIDGANLSKADLTEAVLPVRGEGVNMTGAKAHWTKFRRAVLPELVAVGLDGRNSDWFRARVPRMNATGIKLILADCTGADFSEIYADYRGLTLEEIAEAAPNFTRAFCEGANFSGAALIFEEIEEHDEPAVGEGKVFDTRNADVAADRIPPKPGKQRRSTWAAVREKMQDQEGGDAS
jgi:uncharacterized protein YjbI with pentapeptide repeats